MNKDRSKVKLRTGKIEWLFLFTLFMWQGVMAASATVSEEKQMVNGLDADRLRHHLIVAFDWAPMPKDWMKSRETQQAVLNLANVELIDGIGDQRKVLQEGDFFSCIGFRASVKDSELKQFVMPLRGVCGGKGHVLFVPHKQNAFQQNLSQMWKIWLNDMPFGFEGFLSYSMLTVAKPFCMNYFANCEKREWVNRTFLMVISDRTFNGDMYNELDNLRRDNLTLAGPGIRDDQVYPIYYAVNQSYFIRLLKSVPLKGTFDWSIPNGYAELFEFVPLQQHFSLNNVMSYPVLIKAQRIRGGKFRCVVPISNRQHPAYRPLKLEAWLEKNCLQIWKDRELQKPADLVFEIDNDARVDSLHLKAWVQMQDGVYNATVLSPSRRSLIEAGRNGLNVALPIQYENQARILNFIPLPDFLWFNFLPDDQEVAAQLWSVFSILFLVVVIVTAVVFALVCFYQKMVYFSPKAADFDFQITQTKK